MAVQLCDENSLLSSTLHADLTGPYPVISHKGNKKVMIGWCEYGNYIKSVPVKGDSSEELITGYNTLVTFFNDKLADKGAITSVIRLDNQTSSHLETYFKTVAKASFNYVPPGNHRTLHAERDIRTWKGHFKATRAGTDKSFPANLWDELLPHVDMTLNILRPCNIQPNTSAWDFMCGEWDYKRHPIGPVGAKVLVYENPESRASYADNGVEGFYLGYAPAHYRCHRVWIPSTRDFRDSDTLSWHLADPFGLLSNHSATDDISCAIDMLHVASSNASSNADKDYLQQSATLLLDHISSIRQPCPHTTTSNTVRLPRVTDSLTPTVTISRVSDLPTEIRQRHAQIQSKVTAPIPRVAPSTETVKLARSHHNLRTNKNHVTIDPSPTTHPATKVISHKGSDSTPNNPLRFRIRWLGFTHTSDTFEPFENVKSCKAFSDYIKAHPKLWYLIQQSDAQSTVPTYNDASYATALNATESSFTTESKLDKYIKIPLNKFEMYDLLDMPYTNTMKDEMWVAHAAGDMDDDGQELKFKSCIAGPDKDHWLKADVTEYRKLLSQYEVMHPIKFSNIPSAKKEFVTYYNRQCKTKVKNGEIHYRVRGTYGGNKKSSYTGITASYQASMTTVKMLLNKTISDPASKWMTMDITDMYLHSELPADQWEYMVINLQDIPQEIISEFNLRDFVAPGESKVYLEVVKALYGMKQAGYIANIDVVKHLTNHGYTSQMSTPCLFRHHTDDVEFTLVTDDFGVRYGNKAAADNLLAAMSSKYPMTHDWSGKKYAGFDLLFDYTPATRCVELSMKGYIAAVLKRFKHIVIPTHNVYSPEFFQPINYGSRDSQLVKEPDKSPRLSDSVINLIQQVTGCLLYYTRGVDGTMLLTVDHISREQSNGTQATLQKVIRLLEYAATFPDGTIVYYPSDMILMSNVDGSYNSELNAGSRAAAFHFLGRLNDPNFVNGPIECLTTIIPTVVSSAAETEYASLFIGGKSLLPLRYTLNDMHCPQPSTIIITDNVAAQSIANNTCKQRRSKSMDMRYHWIRDRVKLRDFKIVWRQGVESIVDYLTKTQPVANVLKMRKYYVKDCKPAFPVSRAKRQYFQD